MSANNKLPLGHVRSGRDIGGERYTSVRLARVRGPEGKRAQLFTLPMGMFTNSSFRIRRRSVALLRPRPARREEIPAQQE